MSRTGGVNEIGSAVSTLGLPNSGKPQVRRQDVAARDDSNSAEYQSVSLVVCERAGSFIYVPDEFGSPRIEVVNLNPLWIAGLRVPAGLWCVPIE
jgi:hypothetical protein